MLTKTKNLLCVKFSETEHRRQRILFNGALQLQKQRQQFFCLKKASLAVQPLDQFLQYRCFGSY